MSQTHKSTIYMKYFKLLLLFLFISVQNATATYVEYKYSDEEISKNEKGISLILLFTDLDDNMKAIESGGIRVRFWNDPACTQPIKDTGYQYTEMHNFATSYTIDMSSIPFQENMLARYGNNYIGPMQVYFTIEILEEARLNGHKEGHCHKRDKIRGRGHIQAKEEERHDLHPYIRLSLHPPYGERGKHKQH